MELAPLVVEQRCLMFPLLPSHRHRSESIDAFTEVWVECLLKAVNESYVTELRGGAMNIKFANEVFNRVIALADGS